MDLMERIIENLCRERVSTIEKYVADAFQKHFGISIGDVNLREIERMVVDDLESYSYRGETFLYVQVPGDIDVNRDPQGVKLTMTYKYKEV